ncbi:MAG: Hpt domain-containing protein [bacterium]|nr:Hpt domain-containing protein [bacterium]
MASESSFPGDAQSKEENTDGEASPQTNADASNNASYLQAARSHMGNCDDAILRQVAEAFLEECPRLVGELRTALEAQNQAALARAAHTIKSSARIFDAFSVAELAEEIEQLSRSRRLDSIASLTNQMELQAKPLLSELSRFLER